MGKSRFFLVLIVALWGLTRTSYKHFYNGWGSRTWIYIINMDGRGYYGYLPAIFIHQDPSFEFHEELNAQNDKNINFTRVLEDGSRVNKYFVGSSILMSPFFLVAHFLASISNTYDANGYTLPYYLSVIAAGIFYVSIGLVLLSIFLYRQFKNNLASILAPLFILFGSNLLYYGAIEPSMSHAYSFFLVCAFLYISDSYFRKPSSSKLVGVGLILGLITIVRPVNLLIAAILPFLSVVNHRLPTTTFASAIKQIGALGLGFASMVFLQLLAYKWQTGSWYVWAYQGEGFNWDTPQIFNTLFSYSRGLFVYAPICFFSILGFNYLWKHSSILALGVGFTLSVAIYVVSSWHAWGYGWAYGLRAYIEFLPLFAILLAALIAKAKPRLKVAILILGIACSYYTQVQTYQITEKILPLSDISKETFWDNFLKH